jgi:Tannase and feruloyl esterase
MTRWLMRRRVAVAFCFASALALTIVETGPVVRAQGFTLAVADHGECSHLMMLRLPDIKITEAASVPAAETGAIRAAHCRVNGVIGTEIKFSLLLPDRWNHKFFMGGGGGFVGSVQNSAQSTVNDGYATVGTDTGHQGFPTDAKWALNNLERRVNFGYLAVHRTAEAAKAIIASYYTTPSTKNYFAGCSRGGGQALMEAQRFPDDFDGIVAGAPAFDWPGIGAQLVRSIQVTYPDPKSLAPMFSLDTLKAVEQKILDKCDALDGVKDGVIDDPRRCAFDLSTLTELTPAQRAALQVLYAPVKGPEGEIYPGRPFGGEGQTQGWPLWITGGPQQPSLDYAFGTNFFKYIVFNDPDWDYTKYEFTHWTKDMSLAASYLNATDPNLDRFKARGGKLILWHGWADPALTPFESIRYHEQVSAHDPSARDYFRMFLMPGVLHCGSGNGPDNADWPARIADWVENGKAPDRVVARKVANGAVTRSRPLCAYPQKAEYRGSGSTDDEANFVCK